MPLTKGSLFGSMVIAFYVKRLLPNQQIKEMIHPDYLLKV